MLPVAYNSGHNTSPTSSEVLHRDIAVITLLNTLALFLCRISKVIGVPAAALFVRPTRQHPLGPGCFNSFSSPSSMHARLKCSGAFRTQHKIILRHLHSFGLVECVHPSQTRRIARLPVSSSSIAITVDALLHKQKCAIEARCAQLALQSIHDSHP